MSNVTERNNLPKCCHFLSYERFLQCFHIQIVTIYTGEDFP